MREHADHLRTTIAARTARIGVIGTEPGRRHLATAFSTAGFSILTFDLAPEGSASSALDIEVTTNPDRLAESDVLLLTVPVAFPSAGTPDTSALNAVAHAIARQLRAGQLIVLTSAAPPGTTRAVVSPLLATSGLAPGRDYFLAYSTDPESTGGETSTRVIGGLDSNSAELAVTLMGSIHPVIARVSSLEAAELSGLVGAATRAVHAATANELRLVCHGMGVDVREILDAIKPNGFPELKPGPGGRDRLSFLLSWGVRRYGVSARLVELAEEVNAAMPAFVVSKVADALNDAGKPVKGSRIAILGMAHKKGVDDTHESPGFELMDLLLKKGAIVTYNDPHLAELPRMPHRPYLKMTSSALTPEYLAAQDAVLIVADYPAYDYGFVVANSRLVIDTCNATKVVTAGREKIVWA